MSERQKGYFIKQSFSNDFVNKLEELYETYGEEIFEIQGIANKHMDLALFSKDFFSKSINNSVVADVSVDSNANVREKNVAQYTFENNKSIMKLNSLYMMYKTVKKMFDVESAELALEKVVNGELFINDLHTYASLPYCFAFDLRHLIANGMDFFRGNMQIKPPKRSDSFISLLIQSTAYISNQIAGAASFPDFFVVLDWFYRKELGENYVDLLRYQKEYEYNEGNETIDLSIWEKVKNQFQNFIYSMNFPFRGGQSAFTNLSVMDRGFMGGLFEGYVLPDFSYPDFDSTIELSKIFFEYYSYINSNEGIFTFPVMTIAISVDDDRNYLDPDFVKWAAKENSKKALANIFQDKATSFSSCCRLKNDFSKVADSGYQNSFGVGGLSIGSHRVAGFNLPRIAFLQKSNPNIIQEDLDILHKILYAHRQIIRDRIKGGYLPLYDYNWIELSKQYSTIGFVGGYEYIKNLGYELDNTGIKSLQDILKMIEHNIIKWQEEEEGEKNIYNIEQIPAESMAVRLADIDRILGYNDRWELYSNQYIPLIEEASIYDRMRVQGHFDKLTSGGAILHINVDDEKPLSENQFKRIMEVARQQNVIYFAINYAYSESSQGIFSVGKHDVCPVNGDPIVQQYTRVVGFITPVKSWNKKRRNFEYEERLFYKNNQLEV